MDTGQIISTVVLSVITAVVGEILVRYINRAINANKEQFAELLKQHKESIDKEQTEFISVLRNLNSNIERLTDQIHSLKIELVENYVRKDELEKFKHENREAHKELRGEIRELEKIA